MKRPVVLVADDEAHIVRVVAFKLRSAGFDVIEAELVGTKAAKAAALAFPSGPWLIRSIMPLPLVVAGAAAGTRVLLH